MNGFAALDIHPHRRYVVDIGGRRSSRCRLHINFALFLHSLDFTQNLGVTRFEVHRQWFQSILLALFQKNRISATRTGIRYINIFDTSRIKLQKKYFTSEVASSLQVKLVEEENRPRLIRSMHMAEYRIDEMTMNFRYGMFNPEYPNFLKKNDFALDFDFFSNDIIDSADGIFHVIDKGHYEIQVLFERSITDSLREVMER